MDAVPEVRRVRRRYLQPRELIPGDECCPVPCGQWTEHPCIVTDCSPNARDDGCRCLMIVVAVLPHILPARPLSYVKLAQATSLGERVQIVAELMRGNTNWTAVRLVKTATVEDRLYATDRPVA